MDTIFVIMRPDGTPFHRDDAMGIIATDSEAQAIRFQHAREDEGAEYVRYTRAQPPSAASVSERARAIEILAGVCLVPPSSIAENTDSDVSVELALRALEQALTQKRGECWPLNKNPKDGWTFDPSFLDEVKTRAEQSDIGEFAPCLEGVESVLIALRGMGDTTPQPSADAVLVPRGAAETARTVAEEWLAMFSDIPGLEKYERYTYGPAVEQVRDELESLLSGGSHA